MRILRQEFSMSLNDFVSVLETKAAAAGYALDGATFDISAEEFEQRTQDGETVATYRDVNFTATGVKVE